MGDLSVVPGAGGAGQGCRRLQHCHVYRNPDLEPKRLYSSKTKNVVGVDLPWDEPGHSSIVVQNDGAETPEEIVARLEKFFGLT